MFLDIIPGRMGCVAAIYSWYVSIKTGHIPKLPPSQLSSVPAAQEGKVSLLRSYPVFLGFALLTSDTAGV